MNIRTMFYLGSAYLALVGLAEFVSNASKNSPMFDTLAALPSAGSLLAKSGSATTMGGIDFAGAAALFITARMV